MNGDNPGSASTLPAIASRADFEAAIRWALGASIAADARRIVWADPDLAIWPLDDAALLEPLTSWLQRPQRRLTLIVRDDSGIARAHPRFTAWRCHRTHAVDAWRLAEDVALEVPSLHVDDGAVSVHLIDAVHWRGRAALDERTAHLWRERVDALLQRSESAFPAHQLGL